jgi:uncharacterized protein (TIGR02145 family)
MKAKFPLAAASLSLAMAFTLSCSGEDGKDGNDGTECVLASNILICGQNSYTLPTENPGGGGTSCSISIDAYGTMKQTCGSKVELFAVCGNRVYNTATYFCEENNVKFNFTDPRNGYEYKAVLIGAQAWMAEDVNYNTSGSSCSDDLCSHGRLYDWETAMTICPSGWHLPSREEWDVLISFAGGSAIAGEHLSGWSGKGLDTYGFDAIPSGGNQGGPYGRWWSSNEDGSSNAYYLSMGQTARVSLSSLTKTTQANVRCLKN